jgi:hypothetical protein
MKKSLKVLYVALSVVAILVIIAAIAISLFADNALKMAIESAGTKALSVGVRVNNVKLSILGGRLGLENLVIDNPPGYQHERLLELSEANITVSTRSLLSDVVNIKAITLDGANIVLEQRGISGNNLQDIIKAMPSKGEQESEPSGKKLHIDTLEITNAKVNVKLLPVPGKADTLTLKLAPIKMTDLGGDNDLDSVTLSRKVLLAIAGGIAEQGADLLPTEMLGSLTSQLKKLGAAPEALLTEGGKILDAGAKIGKGAAETGTSAGKEVLKGAEKVGKGITEGLKGLLKSDKKQD